MGDRGFRCRVFVGEPEGNIPLGRPRHIGKIILRWILRNKKEGVWNASSWFRMGTGEDPFWMQ